MNLNIMQRTGSLVPASVIIVSEEEMNCLELISYTRILQLLIQTDKTVR